MMEEYFNEMESSNDNKYPHDRYPLCLRMKIAVEKVAAKTNKLIGLWNHPSSTTLFNVFTTLNFNEGEEEIDGVRFRFCLKGGELWLRMDNGRLPIENRSYGQITSVLPETKTIQTGSKHQKKFEGSLKDIVLSPILMFQGSITATTGEEITNSTSESHRYIPICRVTTKDYRDDDKNPIWCFEPNNKESCMKDTMPKILIGLLEVDKEPCEVEAKFMVTAEKYIEIELDSIVIESSSTANVADAPITKRMAVRAKFFKRLKRQYLSMDIASINDREDF